MARVSVRGLSKTFGEVRAVDAIDLDIADGEFVAILGPSGCGKSTTLFLLSGIEQASSGRVLFNDVDVTATEPMDRGIGLVFQSYALYPHMSVLHNIAFPLEMKRIPKARRLEQAKAAAGIVQVGELLDRRPHQLSGGQQQRVALARALVKEPRLLLLDEPLSNLDASLRHAMRAEIRRLQRKLGLTTVLVTHDQIEATTMADRIVVMNKGRIEQIGTADELYSRPANVFVAGFIGSPAMNLIEVPAIDGAVRLDGAILAKVAPGLRLVILGIRPENVAFGGDVARGPVTLVEPMGREVLYEVATRYGPLRVLDPTHAARFREGDNVGLDIGAANVRVFDVVTGHVLPSAMSATLPDRDLASA
jgi:inositol-phosphate transport system ATP-binding protein